ncbi:hypothetical protein PSTG_18063 [Puccinia striiformis f. sp. tritici PST-78]|uniref:Mediator of RNA polymerase II transcription subunit 11 n=1 Tax=Puccinia striiformis f. sp. tritici PST-78 TaxID=1165861 RepID=A0A0L0UNJ4_9BASI|nr:hypothetical protein PSTG_18063 [Puccinia striiformis f. sp. tritici PST-78]
MSDLTSSRKDLPNLERDLLTALKTNDTNGLINFGTRFSQLVRDMEQAIPANALSEDELKAHYHFSHQVYVAASHAQRAQLAMDQLADEFTQQLNLLADVVPV